MKKILNLTAMFLLTFTCGWSFEVGIKTDNMKQLDCAVVPMKRGSPKGSTHLPFESNSLNWSGYVAVTDLTNPDENSVSDVSGYWTVPSLTATSGDSYSSIWVGIDGYTSSTVEQIGTEQDWISSAQSNYAWFEMYPADSFLIVGFPVDVGDHIVSEVKYVGDDTFLLSIYNYTKLVYYVVPTIYTVSADALRSSAEWIVEAPSSGGILPLADFGTVLLTTCQCTIHGRPGFINDKHWTYDAVTMVTSGGTVKAVPTNLINDCEFEVIWESSGP